MRHASHPEGELAFSPPPHFAFFSYSCPTELQPSEVRGQIWVEKTRETGRKWHGEAVILRIED